MIKIILEQIEKIKLKITEWKRKRKWNVELQLYHLRVMIMDDNRWLAHDKTASELTERYLKMLDDKWEQQPQEDISSFRKRIGLDPHCNNRKE